eukprot:253419-Chlamydomonas_euryale.AAC.5
MPCGGIALFGLGPASFGLRPAALEGDAPRCRASEDGMHIPHRHDIWANHDNPTGATCTAPLQPDRILLEGWESRCGVNLSCSFGMR